MIATARGLKEHNLAGFFPAMPADEFQTLKADIEANGLREPIALYEGKILDGRHRYRACCELGIEPEFWTLTKGKSPAAFVVSENLRRRHLTATQAAAIAVKLKGEFSREAKERQRAGQKKGGQTGGKGRPKASGPRGPEANADSNGEVRARDEAAAIAGASGRSVARAEFVQQNDPVLFEKLVSGEVTVKAAERAIKERSKPPVPPKLKPKYPTSMAMAKVIGHAVSSFGGFRHKYGSMAKVVSQATWDKKQNKTLAVGIRIVQKTLQELLEVVE